MKQPEAPRNQDSITEKNIPHSGEPLSNEFKDTPLGDFEAVQIREGIPVDPSTLPEFMPPLTTNKEVNQTENSETPRLSLKAKIGAALAGLTLVGGATVGVNIFANNPTNEPPVKDPNENSQTDNEGEKPPITEEQPPVVEEEKTLEQLINENKIEAGLSPEEFATIFESRMTDWALAGASEKSLEEWYDAEDKTAFEDELASLQTARFSNALFVPGYHNEPSLVNSEANFEIRNAAWLTYWTRSDGTLELGTVIQEVKLVSEDSAAGERVLYIAGYDTNNAADADYASEETRQDVINKNGESWDHTLTLKTVDGFEYVSKIGE